MPHYPSTVADVPLAKGGDPFLRVPDPLYGERVGIRVATKDDVGFVSALIGGDAGPCMERVVTLLSDNGGFFLEPITSSVFEAHMFFHPEGRGREALYAAREGLEYAFSVLGALVVFGRIPVTDRPARLFTRMIGFKSEGIRPREENGPDVEWFQMRIDELCHPH